MPKKYIRKTIKCPIQRFWAKVAITANPDKCWEWQGSRRNFGYGVLHTTIDGQKWKFAHRIAYYLYYKVNPQELCVCHKCDNPGCCNPNHLFLGTRTENALDRTRKGRSNRWIDKPPPFAKLDEQKVALIRAEAKAGVKQSVLAKRFRVAVITVNRVIRGELWKRVS